MRLINIFLAITFLVTINANAQDTGVKSEIGIFLGPTFLQTDYGQADDFESATHNTGMNFGAAYILDFSNYDSFKIYTDHVKTRLEVSYSEASLEYDDNGELAQGSSVFRAMKGHTTIFNAGLVQEINLTSISENTSKFKPFLLLGAHYSLANPSLTSTTALPSIFLPENENIYMEKQSTFSATGGLGARYQLAKADLFVEMRYNTFFSDKIDGLDSEIEADEHNDNQVIFNFGVIFKLDSKKKEVK